ncbi:hypothetical protein D7B62_12115 [Staphylococcus aureus]|nr:hypothetical protein D7B62_12115 [Staphylococcus aureus]
MNFQGWKITSKGLLMLQKGRPFQIHAEEYYQENLIRAKPRNQRKTLPSMMLLLITFTNNPNRPTSSQVQATGWSKSTSQGRPCGREGKCPRSAWVARASLFHSTGADHISTVRK